MPQGVGGEGLPCGRAGVQQAARGKYNTPPPRPVGGVQNDIQD
jgi:hypothetical protein